MTISPSLLCLAGKTALIPPRRGKIRIMTDQEMREWLTLFVQKWGNQCIKAKSPNSHEWHPPAPIAQHHGGISPASQKAWCHRIHGNSDVKRWVPGHTVSQWRPDFDPTSKRFAGGASPAVSAGCEGIARCR